MTLAVEDKNQKLFDVVAFADVANEQIVDEVLVTADSWVTASQFRQQLDNFNVHHILCQSLGSVFSSLFVSR